MSPEPLGGSGDTLLLRDVSISEENPTEAREIKHRNKAETIPKESNDGPEFEQRR